MTDLATRILDCVPAGSYAIDALFRLVDIVETGEIPTAAIQGGSQLVTPDVSPGARAGAARDQSRTDLGHASGQEIRD